MIVKIMRGDECIKYIDTCKEVSCVNPTRDMIDTHEENYTPNRIGPKARINWGTDDSELENKPSPIIEPEEKVVVSDSDEKDNTPVEQSSGDDIAACEDLETDIDHIINKVISEPELPSNQCASLADEQRIMMIRNSSKKKSIRNLLL